MRMDKMDKIWKIKDVNRLVVALSDRVARKCAYGDRMDALSGPERIFFLTQTCEVEVNNGGFAQLLDNAGGRFACEMVHAFQEIGAVKTAEICRKAFRVLGPEPPGDWEDGRGQQASEEADKLLRECDTAFYRYEEDLNARNYAYVTSHKADFS